MRTNDEMTPSSQLPTVDHEAICHLAEAVVIPPSPAGNERKALFEKAKSLLQQRDAVLVAHYYTDADLQLLADETGGYVSDSLDMARFGHEHPASTLVVAGVGEHCCRFCCW